MKRIPQSLRNQIARRAGFRCEYCLVPERFLATVFHVDHVRSLKHGGLTTSDNLAYSCPHCNSRKGSDVATVIDDAGDMPVRLFNPRKDVWHEHFEVKNGNILSKSPIAEGTIKTLAFNDTSRVVFRQALAKAGKYP